MIPFPGPPAVSPRDADPSLYHLDPVLKQGLVAISFLAVLSFVFSLGLLAFLTYRMINWRRHYRVYVGYNQFVLLIYNLVLADLQQSISFMISIHWLRQDNMIAGSAACIAQGWFVSMGDLASGVFILAIALHTFFTVIKGYRIQYRNFVIIICLLWTFVFLMGIMGPILHSKDVYVPAGAWCWIPEKYPNERLFLHYLWIFVAEFGTVVVYIALYIVLRRRVRGRANMKDANTPTTTHLSQASRYMIIYPIVYVFFTLPLAAGRMASISGHNPSMTYYCVAGAMITSSGWVDVILYSLTRRVIVFQEKGGSSNCGLETFGNATTVTIGRRREPMRSTSRHRPEYRPARDTEMDIEGDRSREMSPTGSTDSIIFDGVKTETSFTVTSELAPLPPGDLYGLPKQSWARPP
ncbi:MAG: hypothetical protein M4579_005031 [Chaenotheca gracillima]|nr:MAG: hypothetical protein M4579_005031 [Chaenotheca gracillima]